MLFLSYVPLLTDPLCPARPLEHKEQLLEMLSGASKEYTIQAIVWVQNGGVVNPVLILPYAEEIRDHMMSWSEGSPKKYFTLIWTEAKEGYSIIILPDFDRSARRYHARQQIKDPLTVLGHVFSYNVEKSGSFNPDFLRDRKTVKVGFARHLPKCETGDTLEYSELDMRVGHISDLSSESREMLNPYFQ